LGRRSRKRRGVAGTGGGVGTRPAPAEVTPKRRDAMTRGYAKAEAKREEIRRDLEPLAPGERPTWVTVAAVVAAVLALLNLLGGFLAVGELPTARSPTVALPWTVLLLIAAIGMWFAKYWAVLGFQAALAFQILTLSLALITAKDLVLAALIIVPVVAALGLLFYKLVRAMARLQLPVR
jgi:hypothetical protein